ncbi:hypothetical protein [Methyloversatilis sp.]|uniref:hypothetical protein n=1 Tax=Methyloversatilis sp. TaxID=2569862 RepID=UPI0035B144F5
MQSSNLYKEVRPEEVIALLKRYSGRFHINDVALTNEFAAGMRLLIAIEFDEKMWNEILARNDHTSEAFESKFSSKKNRVPGYLELMPIRNRAILNEIEYRLAEKYPLIEVEKHDIQHASTDHENWGLW